MHDRGLGINKGANKRGWENSEFPILCESCLGDNPYIRMTKAPYGRECKICQRPYTLFRWKAGTKGRHKETVICQTCAKIKNVCQTCLFDLEYGLPVELRDKFLDDKKVVMPTSVVGREFFMAQPEQLALPYFQDQQQQQQQSQVLQQISKKGPSYKRNEQHYCSFFAKGQCNRGDECPYKHEIPEKGILSKQTIKSRYQGKDDPLAKVMLDNIFQTKNKPSPPEDKTITSLIVTKVVESITQEDLNKQFDSYGEISSIQMFNKISKINFKLRESAEKAIDELFGKLLIKGNLLGLHWDEKQQKNEEQKYEDQDEEEEGLLIPGKMRKQQQQPYNQNQQYMKKPSAPLLPPPDIQSNLKSQHSFLMQVIQQGNQNMTTQQYPSQNPNALGGLRKQVKKF